MKYCLYLLLFFLSASLLYAQPSRWQWGLGTSVHLSNPELLAGPPASSEITWRTGLSALGRYRLNKKANLQWGGLHNRINLFWETGLRMDVLAYRYTVGATTVTRNYPILDIPLSLVLVSEVRHFPWWRRRRLHGYARLGGSLGMALPREIEARFNGWMEHSEAGGVRATLHLSSGLLRKTGGGRHVSVGIFARAGLTAIVQGRLAFDQLEPHQLFRSSGSLFGLEWSYFFGQPDKKNRLPKEPVDMILCPRF